MSGGFGWKRKAKRREKAAVIAGACALTLALEIWRELRGFVVRRCRIKLPYETQTGEEVRIAFLSDLHGKCYGEENRRLLAAIFKERPDYILIGGDLLTRNRKETDETAARLLERLAAYCPVYLANGNHEQRMRQDAETYGGRYEAYMRRARSCGVHVLSNASARCRMKGIPVCISGLEIPLGCYVHIRPRKLTLADIEERIGKAGEGDYQILLAHSPVYFEKYAQWGADLVLSGHLHGGVIAIPGFGGLITPQARLFPRHSGGTYREGGKVSVVSRGLGTHTVNIRLFNPAELVMLTLQPRR